MSIHLTKSKHYYQEELLNSITHGLCVLLSFVGLVWMLIEAVHHGGIWRITSTAIYGISLIILFSASTLYHSFHSIKIKYILKIVDHASIYLLIAGSYSPIALIVLKGDSGWTLFFTIWTMAILGVIFKLFFVKRFTVLSTLVYIIMGWFAIFYMEPLIQHLPYNGLLWLVAGGITYTLGTIFFLWEKLPFNHAIWHLFVMGGSISHFLAIYLYIVPLNGGC